MTTTFCRAIYLRQQADLLRYGVRTVVEVAAEPITLAEARQHLRVDTYEVGSPAETVSDDDAWIEAVLPAAREYCEHYLGRALAPRTMEYVGDAFPTVAIETPPGPAFQLPFGPVQSVESITYTDTDDAPQTVASVDYEVDAISVPSQVVLAYGSSWPTARSSTGSVRVRYVTGYSVPGESPQVYALPKTARAAILLFLGHLYENREAVTTGSLVELPLGVQSLLDLLSRERLGVA